MNKLEERADYTNQANNAEEYNYQTTIASGAIANTNIAKAEVVSIVNGANGDNIDFKITVDNDTYIAQAEGISIVNDAIIDNIDIVVDTEGLNIIENKSKSIGSKQKATSKKIAKESKSSIVRALFLIGGFISLVLGCVGIVMPVLPTVPFFLATSFCFVRGSKKFHDWFLASKLYKRYLEGFVKHKAMSIWGELALMLLVSTMLIVAMVLVNKLAMTIVICVLLAIKYIYFLVNVKPVTRTELLDMRKSDQ